jgi:hypothetical protein
MLQDDLQNVAGAWRHRSLRFGADHVTCTDEIEEGCILLLERPVVEEAAALNYDDSLKNIAAGLLVPKKQHWFPARGDNVDTLAAKSIMDVCGTKIRLRFLHFFAKQVESTAANTALYLSPFPLDSTVVLVSSKGLHKGDEVLVDWSTQVQLPDIFDRLIELSEQIATATRERNRWMSVGMEDQIDQACSKVKELKAQFSQIVLKDLETSSDIEWKVCLRHFAERVSIDTEGIYDELFLPRPPMMTSLHCEQAAEVAATRAELGIGDLETKLRDHLLELKSFELPTEDFSVD